jgi:N-acetylmuramoyl-L-alanine amidase
MKIDYKKYRSPNYSNRKGLMIDTLVVHHTAGRFPGCAEWLCNPASRVSAHYLITRAGEIFCLVPEYFAAWHAGRCHWTYGNGIKAWSAEIRNRSIGLELEYYNSGDFTDTQMSATYKFCRDVLRRIEIPVENVLGHKEIAPGRKTDPAFDMDLFREKLR